MNLPFLKTPQGTDPIIIEAEFSVSAARLYEAWTNAEQVKQWFGSESSRPQSTTVDARKGGRWEIVFQEKDGCTDKLSGQYLSVVENERIEFTWVHTRINADNHEEQSAESYVEVKFWSTESGSVCKLEHRAVAAHSSRTNIGEGWSGSFAKLKALVETAA